jgi:hypothetical protein
MTELSFDERTCRIIPPDFEYDGLILPINMRSQEFDLALHIAKKLREAPNCAKRLSIKLLQQRYDARQRVLGNRIEALPNAAFTEFLGINDLGGFEDHSTIDYSQN